LSFVDHIDRVLLMVVRPYFAMDKSAQPLGDVANPSSLAVFAVADHVHADVRLLLNNTGDFCPQGLCVRGLIV
jgi:hypothetical protein